LNPDRDNKSRPMKNPGRAEKAAFCALPEDEPILVAEASATNSTEITNTAVT
jgi:hypothetical protein